ncbi:MAG: LapA family protein [Rhodospirillales bacterium]|nr:LapA family protein [Rhodospirillales bacterium]
MFKFLSWLIVAPLVVLVAVFSVINRQPISIDLWPLPITAEVPLYAIVLGVLFFGVLWGGLAAWISGGKTRGRVRALTRQMEAAERDRIHLRDKLRKADEAAKEKAEAPVLSGPETPALNPPDKADAA